MRKVLGRRGPYETSWHWCQVDDPPRRRAHRWLPAAGLVLLFGLLLFAVSFGGDRAGAGFQGPCQNVKLEVDGTLTGAISFCAPEGTTVQEVRGIIAVHYPGNRNPCGFPPEPGTARGWFQVPGDYQLVLSGPAVPGQISSASWDYSFDGTFSLCGGENAMRVTIVVITDRAGATAWVAHFGAGAYGVRTESFKPAALATPTPSPTPTPAPTPTPMPTATPSPSPTPTASPTATPSPSPSPTPSPSPSPTPTPLETPSPTPTASPSPSPTPSPSPSPTPSPTPLETPSPTPTASPSPSPTPSPTPLQTASPTPTASPSPSPSPTPTASPTPTPGVLERIATPVRSPGLPPTGGAGGSGGSVVWLLVLLGGGLALAGLIAVSVAARRRAPPGSR